MPDRDDFRWFKDTFHLEIGAAVAGTPFSLDMLAAIAAQETGHIWGTLRDKLSLPELLEICVGDTLDADKGRSAFPRTKADLIAVPRGEDMFRIAHDALVEMAVHVAGFTAAAGRPNKFCHGYGIFQYDLQFFKKDPDYFLEKQWRSFAASLAKCIEELRAAMRRMGIADQETLTDLEKVHVTIGITPAPFKPAKAKQGFSMARNLRRIDRRFSRLSQTVSIPPSWLIRPPAPGEAPAPANTGGDRSGVRGDVTESPLRLRSEPKIDKTHPNANVIARLPDGHRVRLVSGKRSDTFLEVETSLNGAHFQGFAASEFLVPLSGAVEIPVITPEATPPTSGIVAVLAPRKPGSVTRRTAAAGAQSLNEQDQPGRSATTPEGLRLELGAIVDYLAVERASHVRYQPRPGVTFCNIYVHDYCHLAGVFLPRVWWTPDAIERLARGETVEPRLAATSQNNGQHVPTALDCASRRQMAPTVQTEAIWWWAYRRPPEDRRQSGQTVVPKLTNRQTVSRQLPHFCGRRQQLRPFPEPVEEQNYDSAFWIHATGRLGRFRKDVVSASRTARSG